MIIRRRTLVSAAVLGANPWLLAQAQAPAATRSYAVMSLVADKMSVVIRQPQVGSAIDQNRRESVPIAAANIDDSALVAAHEVLKGLEPGAAVHLLKVSEASLYEAQGSLLDGTRFTPPADMADALAQTKATHLLLLTKWRADAQLQAYRQRVGSGKLEGIGYYVDGNLRMRRMDTNEVGFGFLAPYVYAKLSLVDLRQAKVVGDERIEASTTLSAAHATEGVNPWDAVPNAKKIAALRQMVVDAMRDTIPVVLASRPAGG